jgi:hypothetical protein
VGNEAPAEEFELGCIVRNIMARNKSGNMNQDRTALGGRKIVVRFEVRKVKGFLI